MAPDAAAKAAVARLTGAYSLAMIFTDHEGLLIGARKGAPLAVGYGEKEAYLGSDAFALAPFTNRVAYLEDGDVAVIDGADVAIFDAEGRPANREIKITSASAALVDKGGHAISWPRKSTSSRKWSATPWPIISIRQAPPCAIAASGCARRWPRRRASPSRPAAPPIMPAWSANTGSRSLARLAGRSRCRLRTALPRSGLSQGRRGAVHLAVGRDCRHLGGIARCQGERPDHHRRGQCGRKLHRPRSRYRVADLCRAGNRRRLDQGLHLPAGGAGRIRHCRGPGARQARRGRRKASVRRAAGNAAPYRRISQAGRQDRSTGPGDRQGERRALYRPRPELPAGDGRRAEAQGNFLHPCRRLCRRRNEAWPHRADRRECAHHRDRAA